MFFLDPDWILNPYGALVCLQCASIHRSFGMPVTSLALDYVQEDVLVVKQTFSLLLFSSSLLTFLLDIEIHRKRKIQ